MTELCDVIELTVNLPPEQGLYAGQQGALVHRHTANGFEVDFTNDSGETVACAALSADQFIIVWNSADHEWVPERTQLAALVA